MRYRLEYHPNPNCLDIHLDQEVTNQRIVTYEIDSGEPKDQMFTPKPTPEWVKNIFAVLGVEGVHLCPHAVGITKATMFSWRKILPLILFAIKGQFAPDGKAIRGKTIRYELDGTGRRHDLPTRSRRPHQPEVVE